FHVASGAEVTVAAVPYPREFSSEMGVLEADKDCGIVGFEEKPRNRQTASASEKTVLVNMGVYVFNVDALLSVVHKSHTPLIDIANDLIPALLRSHVVKAYRHENLFNTRPLYWRDVGTVQAYYDASMDLIVPDPPIDPYDKTWPMRSAFGMQFG